MRVMDGYARPLVSPCAAHKIDSDRLSDRQGRDRRLEQAPDVALSAEDKSILLEALDDLSEREESPLYQIEHCLQPWTALCRFSPWERGHDD